MSLRTIYCTYCGIIDTDIFKNPFATDIALQSRFSFGTCACFAVIAHPFIIFTMWGLAGNVFACKKWQPYGRKFFLMHSLHNFELSVRIKFWSFDLQIFLVLQATPPGAHLGPIRTFDSWCMLVSLSKGMICGYHIYRDIWNVVIDKKLLCKKESSNYIILGIIF